MVWLLCLVFFSSRGLRLGSSCAARGKVSLYRGKVCVEKNIPTEQAVDKLLELIESDAQKRENI